ncbi:MAG TPA: hypothetical protein VG604_02880 [Candidatus Saccharimonadales bacterium]|nr:hypothetical protein [Candidatus Saccharimonadales bacterium]
MNNFEVGESLANKISRNRQRALVAERQRIRHNAQRLANIALVMLEQGPVGVQRRLTFNLGAESSVGEGHLLPNDHAAHEAWLERMAELGFSIRCLKADARVEYLLHEGGDGFERKPSSALEDIDSSGMSDEARQFVEDAYAARMPVDYIALDKPVAFKSTEPLSDFDPNVPVS